MELLSKQTVFQL